MEHFGVKEEKAAKSGFDCTKSSQKIAHRFLMVKMFMIYEYKKKPIKNTITSFVVN